jgi:hypothetical protein
MKSNTTRKKERNKHGSAASLVQDKPHQVVSLMQFETAYLALYKSASKPEAFKCHEILEHRNNN